MKKAIFVDGASFRHMYFALGIGVIKYSQLMKVLQREVGECSELFDRPFFTITHAGFLTMKKVIGCAGFFLFATRTGNGKDDQAIISRIDGLPDDSEISEVVLVSADSDYIPVLQKQVEKGRKVFVVATEAFSSDGRSMISSQMKEDFNFIDLANFKDKIMHREYRTHAELEDADPERKNKPNRLIDMEVILSFLGNAGMAGNFLADLADIVAKYPGMRLRLNSGPINPVPVDAESKTDGK